MLFFVNVLILVIVHSDPSVDGVKWPQYSASNKAYVTFGNDGLSVGYGPDEADYNFWAGVYKNARIPF